MCCRNTRRTTHRLFRCLFCERVRSRSVRCLILDRLLGEATKEDAAFVPKDVELSKQLRGRQVFNRAEGKLLWVEEMVELTPSLQLRSNDSENKNLLAHVVVRVIKDGELQFRKIGQAAPLMSFSGAFGELLEKGAVRALPLVPTSGWNATYKATDIEGERGLLNAFGIAKARRDIGDQFVVEFTKEDVMQDGRAVYFIKEFSFDERDLRLLQGAQRRGVEGQSLRSADRFHISYEEFNGVDLRYLLKFRHSLQPMRLGKLFCTTNLEK